MMIIFLHCYSNTQHLNQLIVGTIKSKKITSQIVRATKKYHQYAARHPPYFRKIKFMHINTLASFVAVVVIISFILL